MPFDYLIVGCGMFGSVFARLMAEAGRRVMLVDKRQHIGGNCYSEQIEGIHVHRYGPHIFHTNNQRVWDFVNRFAQFNHFRLRTPVNFRGRLYSFPINLMTLHQLWGVTSPGEARRKLAEVRSAVRASPQFGRVDSGPSRVREFTKPSFTATTRNNGGASRANCPPRSFAAFPFA